MSFDAEQRRGPVICSGWSGRRNVSFGSEGTCIARAHPRYGPQEDIFIRDQNLSIFHGLVEYIPAVRTFKTPLVMAGRVRLDLHEPHVCTTSWTSRQIEQQASRIERF
jgi:hypothetical protein